MRSQILTFSALVLLASCASQPKLSKEQNQAALHFGSGTQSLIAQQYTEAVKSLQEANRLDPNNTEILNNLGMAYYFKDEKQMARRFLEQALKVDPNNSDAKINIATLEYTEGHVDAAEAMYKKVLKDLTYDKQARTFYNLGLIEMNNRRNPKAAEVYFEKAVKEDENYCPAKLQLGVIKYSMKNYRNALAEFKEAVKGLCYENPMAHYYQGLTLMQMKKYDDARLKFSEIQSTFRKSPFANRAYTKMRELERIETKSHQPDDVQATRTVLESPDF